MGPSGRRVKATLDAPVALPGSGSSRKRCAMAASMMTASIMAK